MDTHFNSGLSVREYASRVLHVGDLLEWAKSKGLHIDCSPPIDDRKYVQIEFLLCAIERHATNVTSDDAHRIVQNNPALKNSQVYVDLGEPSLRDDPGFSRWLLQSTAHLDWRKRLNIAFAAGELRLLDFGSKLPIEFTPTQSAETATTVVTDSTISAPIPPAAQAVGEPASMKQNPLQRRAELLIMFRQEGGKRRSESGKRGTWGALARVVEKSGIDKDTLGDRLDTAIEEKRRADIFAQLTAKP